MTSQPVLLILLLAADIALWAAAFTAPLTPNGRFRAFALAALLLVTLAGTIVGWSTSLSVAAVVVWIVAIVKASMTSAPNAS